MAIETRKDSMFRKSKSDNFNSSRKSIFDSSSTSPSRFMSYSIDHNQSVFFVRQIPTGEFHGGGYEQRDQTTYPIVHMRCIYCGSEYFIDVSKVGRLLNLSCENCGGRLREV